MAIAKQVERVIESEKAYFEDQQSFADLQEFYSEMQAKGLVVKQTYNLPLLDTIGINLYQTAHKNK